MFEETINAAYYQSKRDAFVAAGFNKSIDACRTKNGTIALYQKHIKDNAGVTLYFINVWEYNFDGMRVPKIVRARHQFSIEVTLFRDYDIDKQEHGYVASAQPQDLRDLQFL